MKIDKKIEIIFQVRSDFLTFLRMFIVFMAAGGITINAIVYPHYPLGVELIKRVFLRAFFGLFVTEKDDLSGKVLLNNEYIVQILLCI